MPRRAWRALARGGRARPALVVEDAAQGRAVHRRGGGGAGARDRRGDCALPDRPCRAPGAAAVPRAGAAGVALGDQGRARLGAGERLAREPPRLARPGDGLRRRRRLRGLGRRLGAHRGRRRRARKRRAGGGELLLRSRGPAAARPRLPPRRALGRRREGDGRQRRPLAAALRRLAAGPRPAHRARRRAAHDRRRRRAGVRLPAAGRRPLDAVRLRALIRRPGVVPPRALRQWRRAPGARRDG